jgi:cytochrome c peroxidase
MSANGAVSCATCHQPERNFTDGRQKAQAIGQSARNTRSIVGAARPVGSQAISHVRISPGERRVRFAMAIDGAR